MRNIKDVGSLIRRLPVLDGSFLLMHLFFELVFSALERRGFL